MKNKSSMGGQLRKYCPVCGNSNVRSKEYFQRDYRGCKDIVPFSYYHVYACENCGMIYAGDMEVSMPLSAYYAKMSRYEGKSFVLSHQVRNFYAREADFIAKYIDKDAAVLDIGCAFGGLLDTLRERGYSNLNGLEISKVNVDNANKELGLNVYQGGLGMNNSLPQKYDLIILSGVLEHLLNLHECVNEIKQYLNSKGKIFVIVPDLNDFCNHEDLYQEFSVEHINYFSVNSLAKLFSMHNIGLEQCETDHVSFYGLAGNLFSLWSIDKKSVVLKDTFLPLENYLSKCEVWGNKVIEKFSTFDMKEGFYIWCAGTQTAMLYQLNCFDHKMVKGIFDSNENYIGEYFWGNKIKHPKELLNTPQLPIFISSQYAEKTIMLTIEEMQLKNEVWTL